MPNHEGDYRGYVGPGERYYLVGRQSFDFLLSQGLCEHHRFLDIGCGSLRLGRLLIPFLMPGNYHGVEPAEEQVASGLHQEVVEVFGQHLVDHKRPRFDCSGHFDFSAFHSTYDYVFAFAVFIHCGRTQLNFCLDSVRAVMGPDSVFYLDLRIGPKSREKGQHPKYEAASHHGVVYSMKDAQHLITSNNFSYEVVELDPHPSQESTRTIFALRLARDSGNHANTDARSHTSSRSSSRNSSGNIFRR